MTVHSMGMGSVGQRAEHPCCTCTFNSDCARLTQHADSLHGGVCINCVVLKWGVFGSHAHHGAKLCTFRCTRAPCADLCLRVASRNKGLATALQAPPALAVKGAGQHPFGCAVCWASQHERFQADILSALRAEPDSCHTVVLRASACRSDRPVRAPQRRAGCLSRTACSKLTVAGSRHLVRGSVALW